MARGAGLADDMVGVHGTVDISLHYAYAIGVP
jgi:hypothetical protein